MNTINIFLGSSIVELKEERDAFSDIINELNVKLKNTGYFIYLDKCEYDDGFLKNTPTQQIIDESILGSTYSYFIVRTRFGEYTKHEFDIAWESFLKTGKPKLSVMFGKCLENESLSEEAVLFQNRLKELRYYYKEYQNKEELKLNVILNLAVDDIILAQKMSVEDGGIYIGNTRLINTELIPIYSKHSQLIRLHKQLDELELEERKCEDKRGRRLLREKIHIVIAEIRKIEKLIYQTMLGLTKATRGEITPLLSRAIGYIENGNIEKAAEILNVNDVIDELEEYKDKAELSIEGIQSAIETTYIAIETMTQLPESLERSKEIELLFEKIISLEIYYNLNRLHCGLYARYLYKRKMYDKAEKYILLYIEAADTRIDSIRDFAQSEYALLGMQLDIEQVYEKDPKKYQELYVRVAYSYILIYSQAINKFQNDININPYMLGIWCDKLVDVLQNWVGEKDDSIKSIENQLNIEVEILKKVGYHKMDISELDGEKDAKRLIDQLEFMKECEKLNDEPQTDEPKEYLKEYVEKIKNLLEFLQTSDNMFAQNNGSIPSLFADYNKLTSALEEDHQEGILLLYSQIRIEHAEHYVKIANFSIAERDYRAAYDKLRTLTQQDEEVYKLFLCVACLGLSITLSYLSRHQESENILVEGISVCKQLIKCGNQYYRLLAKLYTNYIVLCLTGRVYDCLNKGMKYSSKAYDIYEAQKDSLNDDDKISFVKLCYFYGLLLLENGKSQEALKYLLRSLDIINSLCERSVQENHGLIDKAILLAIHLSIKVGEIDQVKKQLGRFYSEETIEAITSGVDEKTN